MVAAVALQVSAAVAVFEPAVAAAAFVRMVVLPRPEVAASRPAAFVKMAALPQAASAAAAPSIAVAAADTPIGRRLSWRLWRWRVHSGRCGWSRDRRRDRFAVSVCAYYGGGPAYYDDQYVDDGAVAVAPAPGGDDAAYCAQRFRSYDPGSGTYLGNDGLRHPCP